jgi:hypothetical protein
MIKCIDSDCPRHNTCKHYASTIVDGLHKPVQPNRSMIRADRDNAVDITTDDYLDPQPPMVFACSAYQSRYYTMPHVSELIYEARLRGFVKPKTEDKV